MAVLRVPELADDPLAAAAAFHSDFLPEVVRAFETGAQEITIVFSDAGNDHRGWQLAAVQSLARKHAPVRVNAVAGEGERAVEAAAAWLARAPGVTGQLLPVDGEGAGEVLHKAQ